MQNSYNVISTVQGTTLILEHLGNCAELGESSIYIDSDVTYPDFMQYYILTKLTQ